jgi:hypothetical protein
MNRAELIPSSVGSGIKVINGKAILLHLRMQMLYMIAVLVFPWYD